MDDKNQPTKLDAEYNAALVALQAFDQLTRDDPVSLESSIVGLFAALLEVASRMGIPSSMIQNYAIRTYLEKREHYNREVDERINSLFVEIHCPFCGSDLTGKRWCNNCGAKKEDLDGR